MHEDQRIGKFIPLMRSLYGAARENLGFKPHAKICIVKSGNNMENPLGKTAYYSPSNHKIGLYTQGRHIKDILRSLAHELVHHEQNCRGDFEQNGETVAGYAQEDGHLREMEREAYERGNMIFRDWEDNLKDKDGKPLFTSISQYVPAPSNDVVGMPLFEQKKMKKRLNEQAGGLEAAIKKQLGDDDEAEKATKYLYKLQTARRVDKVPCAHYMFQLRAWSRAYDKPIELAGLRKWLPMSEAECKKQSGVVQDKGLTWKTSKALDAFEKLTGVAQGWRQHMRESEDLAEGQKQKTNNSLFEGDKMNKKLKESQLRTIVRETIQEMFNEDYIDDANRDELAYGAEIEAEKSGGQPGAIYKGSLEEGGEKSPREICMEKFKHLKGGITKNLKVTACTNKLRKGKMEETATGEFDQSVDTDDELPKVGFETGPVFEDSGEEEEKHYDRNVDSDEDHIEAIRGHLDALEHDKDYDEGHEDFHESFLPKGRSVLQKARTELNETLMKRWTKIIK